MDTEIRLDQKTRKILYGVERPASSCADIDTRAVLFDVASKAEWGATELEYVDFLSTR